MSIEIINIKKKEVAGWIRESRILANLTQAQLADKLGVVPMAVSLWELGKNNPSAAVALVIKEICESEQMRKGQKND